MRAPYTGLADDYDRSVGAALHPVVRAGFESLVRDFDLDFASVADIGCGTGAFLSYLSRYGTSLWGVDSSPAMLRVAARRLRNSGIQLLRQDMRALRLPTPVDLIVCTGDTLNYLIAPADLAHVLLQFRRSLRPRGHFICDLLTGTPVGCRSAKLVRSPDGRVARWRCFANPSHGLTWVEYAIARPSSGGMRWMIELHRQRWFPVIEVLRGLSAADLGVRALRHLDNGQDASGAWLQILARAGR